MSQDFAAWGRGDRCGMVSDSHLKVVVLGLGYSGLPTAAVIARTGVKMLGVDVSEYVVETVNSGKVHRGGRSRRPRLGRRRARQSASRAAICALRPASSPTACSSSPSLPRSPRITGLISATSSKPRRRSPGCSSPATPSFSKRPRQSAPPSRSAICSQRSAPISRRWAAPAKALTSLSPIAPSG